jgi:hypothetical protein
VHYGPQSRMRQAIHPSLTQGQYDWDFETHV